MQPSKLRLLALTAVLMAMPIWNGPLTQNPKSEIQNASVLAQPTQKQTQQQQLLTIYQPLRDLQWEGQRVSKLGIVYLSLGEEVNPWITESDLEQARLAGDRSRQAKELAKLGLASHVQGDYAKAINYYKQGLGLAQELRDEDLQGFLQGNLGLAYAQSNVYYVETLDAFNAYENYVRAQGRVMGGDRKQEGIALGNLGNAYFGADLYAQAIEIHQKRLALARELKDRQGEAKALGDLGMVYQALGQSTKAIDYQQQRLSLSRSLKDRLGESKTLGNLGIIYHTLNDHQKAIEHQQQRLAIARELSDLQEEAKALGNLAGAYYLLGDTRRAIELYDQSWKIAWNTLRDGYTLYGVGGNRALAYAQMGDYPKAIQLYNDLLTYAGARDDRRAEGVVRNNLAIALWQSGNSTAAEASFREGVKVWESLRARLGSNDTYKVSIFETQNAIYSNLQAFLTAQNQPEAALEIAERGRARAFVELLTSKLSAEAPTPLKTQLPTIQQIQRIAKDHSATLVEYSILYERSPSQGQVQTRESELLIWVIQPTGKVTLRRVDLKSLGLQQKTSLPELIATTRSTIGLRGRGLNFQENTQAVARVGSGVKPDQDKALNLQQLHQLLIQPIADLLPQNPNDRVIFIPQGTLFLTPFPALQDASGKYLIEKHTILTAPAIQVLDLTRQQRQKIAQLPVNNTALVLGNPTMPSIPPGVGEPPQQLPELPGAEQEAKAIAQLLGTQALIGKQGTKAAILQRMPQARLIHLATHGLLDDFQGLGIPGAIALAPSGKDNGLLTAPEILNLKLNAELVVLSACDTGRGRITGDGVVGLSRSLIAAGVPSVLVSLWQVPDTPTASLMTEFYNQLKQHPDKAQALRQAMLTTMQQYPDPRDWAAFTLVGEAE